MKKLSLIFTIVALMVTTNLFAISSTDVKGSKDYSSVSRFDDSVIQYYKMTKWGVYKLPVYKDNKKEPNYDKPLILEGQVQRWQYTTSPDNNPAYVMKNFEKAFKDSGYTILLEGKPGDDFDEGPASFYGDYYGSTHNLNLEKFGFGFDSIGNHKAIIIAKTNKDGKDIYVVEVISDFSNVTVITQDVITVEEAKTGMVTAKSMEKGIAENGHIAVYDILFDTGKSNIKPQSSEALKSVATYLNANPDKKYIIVGHTDNVGDFNANLKLSKYRANMVKKELVSKYGVKSKQLMTFGDGQTSPVSTNSSDAGKIKNRRVEIVEQ